MEDMKGIEVDALLRKMYIVYPNLPQSEEFSKQMRAKLEEQIKCKIPKVELEQIDLSYIILNVKKSLTEYQSRIDDTIAQQKMRRTTRVRKVNPHYQDSPLLQCQQTNSRVKLSSPSPSPSTSARSTTKFKCASIQTTNQSDADLGGLVQVESLPSTASRNLVTILIPSILQEKLQSFKYKISIDLNRLDLTKKILDSNVSHLESDTTSVVDMIDSIQRHECKLIYEVKDPNNLQLLDETQTAVSNIPRVEVKTPLHESEALTTISIVREKGPDTAAKANKRAPKRTCPQPLKIKEPPKKRGRKPGSKNKNKQVKSELAKYVEMFECSGNSPSSAVSQTVTSTTKNWEISPDQTAQIAYFMNGEWTTLSAPANNDPNTMVTTTNLEDAAGNEIIPFDDFVNFIDNNSVDVGNNVIAQVLGAAIDTHDEALNPQQQDNPKQGELSIEQPKNSQTTQYNLPGQNIANIIQSPISRQYDLPGQNTVDSILQSPTCRQQTAIVDNCSKQINPDVLSANTNQENNVIFSTGRSMPSLDISDEDLFYSTPERTNIPDSVIAFSTEPYKATTSDPNPSIQEHEDNSDSAIGMEKQSPSDSPKDETIASNVKDKSEGIKEMSLLEIEKDFDDSLLEFNNLDDDLLSLAPSSCFNSPVDDRFSDSIFINDETKGNTNPAPRSHLESSLVTLNEDVINPALKTYKIPRVKIIKNISISQHSPEKKTNPTHPIASAIKNHSEGATSSATASAIVLSSSSNAGVESRVDTNSNQIESNQMISTLQISKLFGSLCSKFLADMCFEPTCKASHQLLDIGIVSISISRLRNEELNAAYRFAWRIYKLFKLYFAMFCEEFGRRNMRQKLLTMVHDCQLQPKCTFFLKNIYINLLACGLGRVNACRLLLNRVEDKSHPTIDVLLEIIIESDAQMFASTIEQFSNVNGYKFSMKQINELAKVCLRSGSVELVPVLIKCLIDVDQNDFLTLRSPELIQLLEMIKSGDV